MILTTVVSITKRTNVFPITLTKILNSFVFILFLALFFSGIHIVSEPVKVVPYDFALLIFSLVVMLILLYSKKMCLPMELRQSLMLTLVLFVWLALETLLSADIEHSTTLLIIMVRCIFTMLFTAIVMVKQQKARDKISHIFFYVSILVVVAALPIFLILINDPSKITAEPDPGLIYRTGEGLVPHFQGYNHNPIYFGTLCVLSIIIGLLISTRPIIKVIGLMILVTSISLTFQRGPLISFILSISFVFLMVVPYGKVRQLLSRKIMIRVFLIGLIAILVLMFVKIPSYNVFVFERILYRFSEAKWESRLVTWLPLLSEIAEHPLIGYGLRGAELELGAQVVENSYVEILYDQGVIGMVLWGAWFVYVLFLGIRKLRMDLGILPWVLAWMVILISMMYISMQFDPLTWIVAGLIIGWRGEWCSRGRKQKVSIRSKKTGSY